MRMPKARPTATDQEPERGPHAFETAGTPSSADSYQETRAPEEGYVVLSHEALFAAASREERCDACGARLPSEEDDNDDAGYLVRGQGVYHWVRGDEARSEKVPLCPSCAAAIGMTALARWEIEEEEG